VAALATPVIGFLWCSLLFARPWMGYDPDDRAKLGEMQKGAGPMYALSPGASLLAPAVLGKIIVIATSDIALYGIKIGLAVWLGFVTRVQLTNAFQQAVRKALRDQYRLSAGM
jgi:hypothetical protein